MTEKRSITDKELLDLAIAQGRHDEARALIGDAVHGWRRIDLRTTDRKKIEWTTREKEDETQ